MEPFARVHGLAVPFLEDDIDTDVIFPARFLLRMEKAGLGGYLFHDRRADPSDATFVLDRPAYAGARILIAGMNFGCGSSREQAVWTLVGAGFRCVIAPSFGDIFYANCFKNGLLPVVLPQKVIVDLAALAEQGQRFTINLVAQTVRVAGRPADPFEIAPQRREALLSGRDDIAEILLDEPRIAAFEARSRRAQPWLFSWEAPGAPYPLTDGHTP